MPYANLGIIKVPERIARCSACIAVCIYKFVSTGTGQKQTALQYWVYLQPGQREVNVITTDVRAKGHMHRVQLVLWRHRTEHGKGTLLLLQQHHISPYTLFALNTLKKGVFSNWLLLNTVQGHSHCKSMRSMGIELMLRLEDLDLNPEQFQSWSSGSSLLIHSRLIAGCLASISSVSWMSFRYTHKAVTHRRTCSFGLKHVAVVSNFQFVALRMILDSGLFSCIIICPTFSTLQNQYERSTAGFLL